MAYRLETDVHLRRKALTLGTFGVESVCVRAGDSVVACAEAFFVVRPSPSNDVTDAKLATGEPVCDAAMMPRCCRGLSSAMSKRVCRAWRVRGSTKKSLLV